MTVPIDLLAFCALLAEEFELTTPPDGTEGIVDDLAFDSLELLRLALFLELVLGVEVPELDQLDGVTVGDLHTLVRSSTASTTGP